MSQLGWERNVCKAKAWVGPCVSQPCICMGRLGDTIALFAFFFFLMLIHSFIHFSSVPGEQNGHPPCLIRSVLSREVPSRKHFFFGLKTHARYRLCPGSGSVIRIAPSLHQLCQLVNYVNPSDLRVWFFFWSFLL